jgi:hypothetical protein
MVLAIPSVEDLHNLPPFPAQVKPQGLLPRTIPIIAFNADLHGLNPGTTVFQPVVIVSAFGKMSRRASGAAACRGKD